MYDHVGLRVRNLDASVRFYEAALAPLGLFAAEAEKKNRPSLERRLRICWRPVCSPAADFWELGRIPHVAWNEVRRLQRYKLKRFTW